MPLCMFGLRRENHEIFWRIISFVAIQVMDYLSFFKRSTENLLRDNPMSMPTIGLLVSSRTT